MAKKRHAAASRRNTPPKATAQISAFPAVKGGPSPPFSIVGIGASAGGFEAFSQLLEALPPDAQLAIIFVQHLAPQHESALTALLGTHSRMPVVEVLDGMGLHANHIYVVPPNVQMDLAGGRLYLTPRPDDKSQYTPIDHFFRSLARTLKQNAIGVVLSGTASDGADGLREIKLVGGIALAQDPDTARYDGMPRAAIATRMVDLVLEPKAIAAKLAEIAAHPILSAAPSVARQAADHTVTEGQLDRVFTLLLPAGGVDFAHYKSPTIMRRLLRRMALLRINDADAYLDHLAQTPEEVINLHNDLLIHVTRFFREPEAFEVLAREVLPGILSASPDGQAIRSWVAGCATGEEAYSLAILLHEQFAERLGETRIQIFATDVSDPSIEFARHGLYPLTIASDVSAERLRKFFTKTDGGYRVTKALRDLCVFARQDLTRDPPFSRLDLICCRNVLIYMDSDLQKKLLSVFHYALKPGGVLLLGHAETIGFNNDLFLLMNKKHRIYRKKPGAISTADLPTATRRTISDLAGKRAADAHAGSRAVAAEVSRIMLDRYAPPSVLVDENFHVVHFSGQTGAYLEPSPGEPSFHVLKLAREGLLHGLRAALQTAQKTRRRARKTGLNVKDGATWHEVDVDVSPVVQQDQTFYLISFETPNASARKKPRKAPRRQRASNHVEHRAARLEEELAATREYLQSTIQEIEAANEEMQSANEEILSSNEELQSTNEELDTAKEELQSTNEELNTVNDELQGRNEELTRANADLINLLSSVHIAIVIVSNDLLIRRFTPMAEKTLNLIPSDVGRPFTQISPNIELPELSAIVANAIETVTQVEREVQDRQGHWYLLRIRPYKNADNRIDGAVVALFDIDAAKRAASSQVLRD
ncbi:MAG TPA: chemotaxis protein CheB [Vicinamibacterales bacterium]|jgi:two-component system CheB/CheR fusion protein|nr:chemotaxis protein CheB [Vicinamibacterales bacterium]